MAFFIKSRKKKERSSKVKISPFYFFQISQQHVGQYSSQKFNQMGSTALSPIIQDIIKDPPTLPSQPNNEHIKNM